MRRIKEFLADEDPVEVLLDMAIVVLLFVVIAMMFISVTNFHLI